MKGTPRGLRSRALMLVVAGVGAVAIAGTAIAGHQTSGVKSYTGCLVPNDGVLVKIKEGPAPKSACTGGQVEAHFSGGDITEISVGNGLVSTPNPDENGAVRIELAAGQTLPSNCAAGRLLEWSGSAWICRPKYTAGVGLFLDEDSAGREFRIDQDYRVKNTPDCPSGQFATGFESTGDSIGDIVCGAPSSAGIEVWHKVRPSVPALGVVQLPKGEGVDVVIMPLPAGTFLITAVATLGDNGADDEVHATCRLRDKDFNPLPVHEATVDIGDGSNDPAGTATVHGVVSLTNPDSVRFTCTSSFGDDDPDDAIGTVTAIKVGTVHAP